MKIIKVFEDVHCPMCGASMSFSILDSSWFCYDRTMRGRCPKLEELRAKFKKAPLETTASPGHPNDNFQWQSIATISNENGVLLTLTTTRSGSQTNLKIENVKEFSSSEINKLISNGWVWAKWVEHD